MPQRAERVRSLSMQRDAEETAKAAVDVSGQPAPRRRSVSFDVDPSIQATAPDQSGESAQLPTNEMYTRTGSPAPTVC